MQPGPGTTPSDRSRATRGRPGSGSRNPPHDVEAEREPINGVVGVVEWMHAKAPDQRSFVPKRKADTHPHKRIESWNLGDTDLAEQSDATVQLAPNPEGSEHAVYLRAM